MLALLSWWTAVAVCIAQTTTTDADSLLEGQRVGEVTVVGRQTFREVIPSQTLKGKDLERLSTHNVADALRYFSGIQLKDYGGVGGVKTVDVRSMGSNHLGIYYDGVQLGNAQNGQIDLAQFSLDNMEEVTLYNGQKSSIGQSASDFGNASSIYLRTRVPFFPDGERERWRTRVKYGSSDMLRASVLWERRLSDRLVMSANGEVLTASGKYKFRYHRTAQDGTTAWDTTATRQNGDIHAERVELNLHGRLDEGSWSVKAYLYNSERGIPGAIVNNVWKRGERQADLNTFGQAHWHKNLTERLSTRWTAKYAFYNTHYTNRDETTLPVDNRYLQKELYVSTANVMDLVKDRWSVALSYDFRWNHLNSDIFRFTPPTRLSNLVAFATAANLPHVKLQGSLLASIIHDKVQGGKFKGQTHWTPALFVNVYPWQNRVLSVRAFVKRSFRMPTFNDLYYTDLGNASLRPETAMQWDLGVVLDKRFTTGWLRNVKLQADGYINRVNDKIIAYPKGQQFRWTMLNLGKVDIKGVDVEAEATLEPVHDWLITARVQYTYQDARDVTDERDAYYRDQIPYIPWHSGSAILGLHHRQWDFNYSFIYAGERYNAQENTLYNHMQPWYTSDLSLIYGFNVGKTLWRLTLEVNNVFDQNYDVIANYPMPGRNFGVSAEIRF